MPIPRRVFTLASGEIVAMVGGSPVRLRSRTGAVAVAQQLQEDPERWRGAGNDSDQPMTTRSGPPSPERRLALLHDIRDGRDTLQAGPSPEAQAVLAAKLAEWRELVKLQDIRLRTIQESTAAGEEVRVALATLTLSGLRFLEEHDAESGEPTEEG